MATAHQNKGESVESVIINNLGYRASWSGYLILIIAMSRLSSLPDVLCRYFNIQTSLALCLAPHCTVPFIPFDASLKLTCSIHSESKNYWHALSQT